MFASHTATGPSISRQNVSDSNYRCPSAITLTQPFYRTICVSLSSWLDSNQLTESLVANVFNSHWASPGKGFS